MANQESRFRRFLHWIAPNAIWDVIKWIGGSSIMASIGRFCWLEFHKSPVDWYWLAGLLIVGIILTFVGVFFQRRKEVRLEKSDVITAQPFPDSLTFLFPPLQTEILQLIRDLRQLLKDAGPAPTLQTKHPGPMPKGANVQVWTELQKIESDEWMKEYSEWARKLIYSYRQHFADRVKKFRDALGASTGLVVVSLDPYTLDIRPGDDFQNLLDILLDFFVKLEGGRSLPLVKTHEVASANLPNFLDLKPYPLELILSEHSADPASVNFICYRDRLVFKLQNKWDTEINVCKPFWQSQEVSAQAPLYARF